MNGQEFNDQASAIASQIPSLDLDAQIAAACRGSGNPVALTWLAENLQIADNTPVVDLGAGLGGPAAWLQRRYRCRVVALEPAVDAARAGAELFDLAVACGSADQAPFGDDAFRVAALLGVLSVVDDRRAVLREARRLAPRLGVLDYCSVEDTSCTAGGSTFPSAPQMLDDVARAGWSVVQTANLTVPSPYTWKDAAAQIEVEPEPTEREVVDAIEKGRIAPFMLVASRA